MLKIHKIKIHKIHKITNINLKLQYLPKTNIIILSILSFIFLMYAVYIPYTVINVINDLLKYSRLGCGTYELRLLDPLVQ